jgi:hypothetical protein
MHGTVWLEACQASCSNHIAYQTSVREAGWSSLPLLSSPCMIIFFFFTLVVGLTPTKINYLERTKL